MSIGLELKNSWRKLMRIFKRNGRMLWADYDQYQRGFFLTQIFIQFQSSSGFQYSQ
jgi:hypothetical protein